MSATQPPLVGTAELYRLLQQPIKPVLLDVRWSLANGGDHAEFMAGHLLDAQFVDLDLDLAAPAGAGGRHPLPDPEHFAQTMRRLGLSRSSTVVCYDAGPATAAARAWWLLRYFGHAEVRVLDGGYRAWLSEAYPVSTTEIAPPAGDFSVAEGLVEILDANEVLDFAATNLLIDARETQRYLGLVEPVDPVAGHIPGAVNMPTTDNNLPDGRFRPAAELAQRFAEAGAQPDRSIGVYCGSGITAAHEILALEIAGRSGALYAGSWSHWITDPSRPVATGSP